MYTVISGSFCIWICLYSAKALYDQFVFETLLHQWDSPMRYNWLYFLYFYKLQDIEGYLDYSMLALL